MTDEKVTNLEITILEIISQHRDLHALNIMAQIQEMNRITGQEFDKDMFIESMNRLEKNGYIRRLVNNPETFGITEKGDTLLES